MKTPSELSPEAKRLLAMHHQRRRRQRLACWTVAVLLLTCYALRALLRAWGVL